MSKLASKLRKEKQKRDLSVWQGPCSDGPNGGITQSMLSSFLVCRERFRVKYVLGLQPQDTFNHRIEYGNMWHACEESLAAKDKDPWAKLDTLTVELCKRYPLQQKDILHWYNICKVQFPVYVEHWSKHEDVVDRTPLMQEHTFRVSYEIPSGRTVYLRGKFDSVDLIGDGIWLQENKTKGDIDPVLMQRQLTFDLQTGLYLTALSEMASDPGEALSEYRRRDGKLLPVAGVRYNVIRRPLSGGKGSIKQKQGSKSSDPESDEEFCARLGEVIQSANGPEWGVLPEEHYFFMRWKVEVPPQDIEVFKIQFLNPVLEQLCDWWEHIARAVVEGLDPFCWGDFPGIHFRMPYGVYSPLLDGRPTEMDEYLSSGSTVGLHKVDSLFREL